MFHFYQLPVPRRSAGDPWFDQIVPRAAQLTCTTPDFADLWQSVIGTPWDASQGATDPIQRQRLRDELDVIIAHLYGLARAEFGHILTTFPLIFSDDTQGNLKRQALLALYDTWQNKLPAPCLQTHTETA
jgi:hypothetical protein